MMEEPGNGQNDLLAFNEQNLFSNDAQPQANSGSDSHTQLFQRKIQKQQDEIEKYKIKVEAWKSKFDK